MHRAVVVLLAGLTACNGFPAISIPQAEQAVQATEGGGERLRIHQTCVAAHPEVDDLVRCMEADGYQFVPRMPGFPGAECWALRDDADMPPPPHCFEHISDAAP